MLKLIVKMPKNTDAHLLMITAIALADYKHKNHNHFRDMKDYDGIADYDGIELRAYEPDAVYDSPTSMEDFEAGVQEYELHGDILDPFIMTQLVELQKIIPFEMYFENRGKYDAEKWMYKYPDWTGDIYDSALHTLFWQGCSA